MNIIYTKVLKNSHKIEIFQIKKKGGEKLKTTLLQTHPMESACPHVLLWFPKNFARVKKVDIVDGGTSTM